MRGKYDSTEGVTSREMVLFFMADTSGSMSGKRIGTLNEAINNVIPEIKRISADSADATIKIAVMKFSCGAEWIYPAPVDAESFKWKYLDADGWTDFGAACRTLKDKLSRKTGFMAAAAGAFAPVIFLLSDGEPTDEYHTALEQLRNNSWFNSAVKVAVAIGEDANEDVLVEFTGTKETVVKVHTPEALSKLVRFIAVTSSQIGSNSQDRQGNGNIELTKQHTVGQQIQSYVDNQLNDSDDDDWD
ncbi:tellurium resistance protein TerY [Clostridia bacterium]|nr:tellurium resistance protein TerY [Clostridia bacterium]